MKVTDRIEVAPACDVINLTEQEREHYTGCGWHIAGFKYGTLARLTELDTPVMGTFDESVSAGVANTVDGLKSMETDGMECWLVMCSCRQLCEPQPVTSDDALAVAKITRRLGDDLHQTAQECGGWEEFQKDAAEVAEIMKGLEDQK